MLLNFNPGTASGYKSQSNKIRVLTEDWVDKQIYCPNCGRLKIDKYPNNKPVADFYCLHCREDYELKSKMNNVGAKIVDGAYATMMKRLRSSENPNLFLLSYNLEDLKVLNFLVVPKQFFIPKMIEERKPLSPVARRAGWIGCNIVLRDIPAAGKIFLVKNGVAESKEKVLLQWQKTLFLREEKMSTRGWTLDMMQCIEKIKKKDFTLEEVYRFEKELYRKHPSNRHIKDKIRQQLQILRDRGYLRFVERGKYRIF